MFGGLAASGSDQLVFATFDGAVLTLDPESGELAAQFTVFPSGPERVHISAVAVRGDGLILLGDALNHHVRGFDLSGRQCALYGGLPTPGLEQQDAAGILDEPCALLVTERQLVVACGGLGLEHGVQVFRHDGRYVRSLARPRGWKRAHGLAAVDDAIWVAETEAGRIRRFAFDGRHLGEVDLHADLRRPLRIAADRYGGVLMVLAPELEAEPEACGVARLRGDGEFDGWAVEAGEKPGSVFCPYDLAVLPDGRFAVADLPLGEPPEVRVQLFSTDGRRLATPFDGTSDLAALQASWFRGILDSRDDGPAALYERARVHHFHAGGDPEHLREARRLYRAAIAAEPGFHLAHLGLATLLARELEDPAAAELAYRAALGCGDRAGDLKARIAECRRAQGDLDGAIGILREAIEGDTPPEDYHARVEDLGTMYLERSGETP